MVKQKQNDCDGSHNNHKDRQKNVSSRMGVLLVWTLSHALDGIGQHISLHFRVLHVCVVVFGRTHLGGQRSGEGTQQTSASFSQ